MLSEFPESKMKYNTLSKNIDWSHNFFEKIKYRKLVHVFRKNYSWYKEYYLKNKKYSGKDKAIHKACIFFIIENINTHSIKSDTHKSSIINWEYQKLMQCSNDFI